MGGACLVVLPSLRSLKPRYTANEKAEDKLLPKQQNFDAAISSSSH